MKKLLLIFLFMLPVYAFAQTIPYATQQPKWVFPVYAKDATGKRDTIYLGHNPGASATCGAETNFGEIWFPGVSDFSLSTYFWLDPIDSIIKTNVLDEPLYFNCGYAITLANVVLPVTFYWDVSLMRSDSLPFPDQDPLPRAQLNVYYGLEQVVDEPGTTCNISYPIVISDTITTAVCTCFAKDTLRLVDYFGNSNPQTVVLTFEFTPWVGHRPDLSIDEEKNNVIKIFPNPTMDIVHVKGDMNDETYEFFIYDYTLKILRHSELNILNESLIDLSDFNSGIYFFRFTNKYGLVCVYKIVKL